MIASEINALGLVGNSKCKLVAFKRIEKNY